MTPYFLIIIAMFLLKASTTSAFIVLRPPPPSPSSPGSLLGKDSVSAKQRTSSTSLNYDKELRKTLTDPRAPKVPLPYGEESRKYRRNVFGHNDWLYHRRSTRNFTNLSNMLRSGIYRNIFGEIVLLTLYSAVICAYNALVCDGYADLDGLMHAPLTNLPVIRLPIIPFTLVSSSLSLLLVFRTNSSYGRWNESRIQWGVMGTENRNVMRMAAAWSSPLREPDPKKRMEAVSGVGMACFVFMRSLQRHVTGPDDEQAFQMDIKAVIPEKEAQAIIDAGNRQLRALYYMSRKIEALPLSERQRIEVDKSCVIIGDVCGGTERVYGTPVPRSSTRHASRFLTTWLLLLPLALYDPFVNTWNHAGMIPATILISLFYLGIDELAIQLEEPFSILDLPGMVAAMRGFATNLPQWHAEYTNEEFTDRVYGGEENFSFARLSTENVVNGNQSCAWMNMNDQKWSYCEGRISLAKTNKHPEGTYVRRQGAVRNGSLTKQL